MKLEQIYLNVKLSYCYRYRSASSLPGGKLSFINDIANFIKQEFHVHSKIYDFHLSAINTNFSSYALNYSNTLAPTTTVISQTSEIIALFLNQFVNFFSRIPTYSSNKVIKLTVEKCDNSLVPHRFGLIFDFIIDSKRKLTEQDPLFDLKFNTLYLFDNNIAMYSLNDPQSTRSKQQQQQDQITIYFKYLIIKIENFTSNNNNSNTTNLNGASVLNSPRISPQSAQQQQLIANLFNNNNNIGLSSKQLRSNSSSSASLQQIASMCKRTNNNSNTMTASTITSLTNISNQQIATLQKQNSSNLNTKECSFIKINCFYIYIKKKDTKNNNSNQQEERNISDDDNMRIESDLSFINRIIEESFRLYKQEIFWENLKFSIQSLQTILDEGLSSAIQPQSPNPKMQSGGGLISNSNKMPLIINTEELEQVLATSNKIDILDLDKSLWKFFNQCYEIKDRIVNNLKFSLGRYLIYTESESIEYCILLINDDLIKNFRFNKKSNPINNDEEQQKQQQNKNLSQRSEQLDEISSNSINNHHHQDLKSFILLKFDKLNSKSQLMQINRIKVSSTRDNSPGKEQQQHQAADSQLNQPSLVADNSTSISNNHKVSKTSRYLSFCVNLLMFACYETIFTK